MRRIRCHVDAQLGPGARLRLPEASTQHLLRVLRLGTGDEVLLFNGDGSDYRARLLDAQRRGAEVEVLAVEAAAAESPLRITLGQALARGEKMDLVLQKATELGVAALVPLVSERSEVRLDAERAARRMHHWRGVVAAACAQSGRARLPPLSDPAPLASFATTHVEAGPRLILDPGATGGLDALPEAPESLTLLIGPEGGWSERERELLASAGYTGLRLGPRVLRTETAGLAAIAVLQQRFGDLG